MLRYVCNSSLLSTKKNNTINVTLRMSFLGLSSLETIKSRNFERQERIRNETVEEIDDKKVYTLCRKIEKPTCQIVLITNNKLNNYFDNFYLKKCNNS